MAEPAVLQATFADWRTVKGRKQLQLIFEVPIEQQAHVLSVLGAPLGDSATWVAIARLQAPTAPPERAPEPPDRTLAENARVAKPRNPDAADRARQNYRDKDIMAKAAARAGMLRNDPEYQKWVETTARSYGHHQVDIAGWQRQSIGVMSCSELATDFRAYERWKQHLLAFEMATGRAARPS